MTRLSLDRARCPERADAMLMAASQFGPIAKHCGFPLPLARSLFGSLFLLTVSTTLGRPILLQCCL
eukprot:1753100-Pyramimonas_sp.AAC.2